MTQPYLYAVLIILVVLIVYCALTSLVIFHLNSRRRQAGVNFHKQLLSRGGQVSPLRSPTKPSPLKTGAENYKFCSCCKGLLRK